MGKVPIRSSGYDTLNVGEEYVVPVDEFMAKELGWAQIGCIVEDVLRTTRPDHDEDDEA